MPTMSWRRMLAMELATWRSGRSGGASGSVTGGNGRLREHDFVTPFRGGNGAPFGDQEGVGCDAHRGGVVETAPTSPFEMAEPHLLPPPSAPMPRARLACSPRRERVHARVQNANARALRRLRAT